MVGKPQNGLQPCQFPWPETLNYALSAFKPPLIELKRRVAGAHNKLVNVHGDVRRWISHRRKERSTIPMMRSDQPQYEVPILRRQLRDPRVPFGERDRQCFMAKVFRCCPLGATRTRATIALGQQRSDAEFGQSQTRKGSSSVEIGLKTGLGFAKIMQLRRQSDNLGRSLIKARASGKLPSVAFDVFQMRRKFDRDPRRRRIQAIGNGFVA